MSFYFFYSDFELDSDFRLFAQSETTAAISWDYTSDRSVKLVGRESSGRWAAGSLMRSTDISCKCTELLTLCLSFNGDISDKPISIVSNKKNVFWLQIAKSTGGTNNAFLRIVTINSFLA